jgi:Zn-dependent protease with chaperone function
MNETSELGRLGELLPGWVAAMSVSSGALLVVAVLLDRLLERRVSAAVRLLPYLAAVLRLAFPLHWPAPLGGLGRAAAVIEAPAVLLVGAAPAGGPAWLAVVYLVVAGALFARWAAARLALCRALDDSWPARPAVAGLLPSAEVVEHASLGPLATGLLRPQVVVPSALAAAEDSESLRWILRHEGAHLARRDQLLITVLQLAAVAAWPIVPLWLAMSRVRELIELACDERALRGAGLAERRHYGEILLALATGQSAIERRAAVPAFRFALRARLRALAIRRRWGRPMQLGLVTAVVAAAFACAGSPEPDPPPEPAPAASPAPRHQAVEEGAIFRVVKENQKAIKACYERAVAQNPQLTSGRIEVQLSIGALGNVLAVGITSSSFHDPGLESCVINSMSDVRFPAANSPYRAEFPIILQGRL